jgi:hypothetical protein
MSDLPISSGSAVSNNSDQQLNQLLQKTELEQLQQIQKAEQPSGFRKVLGAVTGLAGSAVAPGLGGALGSIIGGNISSAGIANAGFLQNASSLAQANELLQVAQQSNQNEELVELSSNLMKAKHSSAMSVIQNIGNNN